MNVTAASVIDAAQVSIIILINLRRIDFSLLNMPRILRAYVSFWTDDRGVLSGGKA